MSSPATTRTRPAARPMPPVSHRAPPAPRAAAPRIAQSPATGPVAPTARYRYDRRTGSWWWSPEMFAVQGLRPDTTAPGTQSLLRNQHPEDRSRIQAALAAACEDGRAFAVEARTVRPDGSRRALVLVGEPSIDGNGQVVAVDGICVDITEGRPPVSVAERVQELETEVDQLRSAMASRAAIEQAKGILMLLTNCGDNAAFDLLTHISSHTHRKVRDVAAAITSSAAGSAPLPADVRGIIRDACPPASLR